MSFRGLQKSVVRAPQQFRQKFNIGEHTSDSVYLDAERRFKDLEAETKRLHDESKKYFESINAMMNHQIEFSKAIAEIYKPISGRISDPDSLVPSGNIEGIRACEEYEAVVKDLQETLQPELEMIEARVVRPANELMDVIKVIRKTAAKRDHKKLDHDRHRAALKKLQDKKDRSAKDDKALYKAEADVEQATQDFNYFNDLLKDELPRLFTLEQEFIQPLFQSFYYMQLNIFYTLHSKMQGCDIGYFDLTLDIEDAFNAKRGDVQQQAEALSIVKFKTTGQRRPPKPPQPRPDRHALEAAPSQKFLTAGPTSPRPTAPMASRPPASPASPSPSPGMPRIAYPAAASMATSPALLSASSAFSSSKGHGDAAPPPYSPPAGMDPGLAAAIAAKKLKPPPPKPKAKPAHLGGGGGAAGGPTSPAPVAAAASVSGAEVATALYDYSAQAEGDLSFRTGDVIEIVSRTDNANEWWTGRLGGKAGQFPGNYVSLS